MRKPLTPKRMKTPMQELIEWLENYPTEVPTIHKSAVLAKANKILEKEKALLIKTHGNKKVYDSQIDPTIVTGEEWYNKTFNTKER